MCKKPLKNVVFRDQLENRLKTRLLNFTRKKQEATSLEETKEQIVELEKKLASLKDDKHMLFLTLKKVLNEDDSRRRRETDEMYGGGVQHPPVLPLAGHVQHNPHAGMFMNPQSRQPGHAASHYMKPHQMPGLPPAQQVIIWIVKKRECHKI